MNDDGERIAVPIDDAATDDRSAVAELVERQLFEHPEPAGKSTMRPDVTDEELATIEAGGEPVATTEDGVEVEGPNSA